MDTPKSFKIPAKRVRSLAWDGDELVDWVAGQVRYSLDGESARPNVNYAYEFDAAATSPSGEYQVIYTRLRTKGLVLRRGQVIREINRSFYWAHAYEYPIVLFATAEGRELLAHCPEDYHRLEIEDLATGARLTSSESRTPADSFATRCLPFRPLSIERGLGLASARRRAGLPRGDRIERSHASGR